MYVVNDIYALNTYVRTFVWCLGAPSRARDAARDRGLGQGRPEALEPLGPNSHSGAIQDHLRTYVVHRAGRWCHSRLQRPPGGLQLRSRPGLLQGGPSHAKTRAAIASTYVRAYVRAMWFRVRPERSTEESQERPKRPQERLAELRG